MYFPSNSLKKNILRLNFSACPCALERTKPSICDSETGACHCSERFQGENCASCAKRFQNFPVCHRPGMSKVYY